MIWLHIVWTSPGIYLWYTMIWITLLLLIIKKSPCWLLFSLALLLIFISSSSAITIQSLWRKNLACKLKFRLLYSVIAIQAAMRGFSSRIHLKRSHHAATVVQTLWRRKNKLSTKVTADESRLNFIQNRANKKIVSFFRRIHLNRLIVKATLSLQKWFRAYLPLLRARILNRGFKRLQVRTYVHSVYWVQFSCFQNLPGFPIFSFYICSTFFSFFLPDSL